MSLCQPCTSTRCLHQKGSSMLSAGTQNVKIITGQAGTQIVCGQFHQSKTKGIKKCQRLLSIMSTFIFNAVYWCLRSTVVCLCVSQHRGRWQVPCWGAGAAFLKMHNVAPREGLSPPPPSHQCYVAVHLRWYGEAKKFQISRSLGSVIVHLLPAADNYGGKRGLLKDKYRNIPV